VPRQAHWAAVSGRSAPAQSPIYGVMTSSCGRRGNLKSPIAVTAKPPLMATSCQLIGATLSSETHPPTDLRNTPFRLWFDRNLLQIAGQQLRQATRTPIQTGNLATLPIPRGKGLRVSGSLESLVQRWKRPDGSVKALASLTVIGKHSWLPTNKR
jgi:hypothetical protein